MKDIQAWLGHSDYSTTANLYAHLEVSESVQRSASRLNSGLFHNAADLSELPTGDDDLEKPDKEKQRQAIAYLCLAES